MTNYKPRPRKMYTYMLSDEKAIELGCADGLYRTTIPVYNEAGMELIHAENNKKDGDDNGNA